MIIPYEIDPVIDSIAKYRAALISAFYELEAFTCLRFRLRTNEENFLSFDDLEGCWSYVGKIGGKQMISLGKGCKTKGKATHEILHAIGFVHEHQRPGRDEYIQIKTENIDTRCGIDGSSSCQPNFQIINPDFLNYEGVFDEHSVMHYNGFSFAKSPIARNPTIVNAETLIPVQSQRLQASIFDLGKICDMYNCPIDKLPSCHPENVSGDNLSRRCNGIVDCFDMSDELNCEVCNENAVKCFSLSQCILRSQVCDGYKNCIDGSDEMYCDQKCGREYSLKIDNMSFQFQLTDEYDYTLSDATSRHVNLKMTQTDSYWIITDDIERLVAFSIKQSTIDCPQNNLWRFKTVSSWQETEMINLAQSVFGYIGPADWLESVSQPDNNSVFLFQKFLDKSEIVQSMMVLLERIPLHHNGCKVYVHIDFNIDQKHRMTISGMLKKTQCLLIAVNSSFRSRHSRDLNFDDFEMVVDDIETVFSESPSNFYEPEEQEYEQPLGNTFDQGYSTTLEGISNLICNGMHRSHLSGTYDMASGEFLMHEEEVCIESNDCWDNDVGLCFCEISSNQPSCFFEVPDVPELAVSDLFSRKRKTKSHQKRNNRSKKRKYERISTTKMATITSTAFTATSSTTSSVTLSSFARQQNGVSKPTDLKAKSILNSEHENLYCYKCTSQVCFQTEICSHGQICFTEVRRRGNIIIQRQSGCKEKRACLTQAKQSRKSCKPNNNSGSDWSWCYHCCSQNHCNKNS